MRSLLFLKMWTLSVHRMPLYFRVIHEIADVNKSGSMKSAQMFFRVSFCFWARFSEPFLHIFLSCFIIRHAKCVLDHWNAQTSVFPHNFINFLNSSLNSWSHRSTETFIVFILYPITWKSFVIWKHALLTKHYF